VRNGWFRRAQAPERIQRYRCVDCGRHFSDQTFSTRYWLKRPGLLVPVFHGLVGCACFRQLARQHDCSPQTIALQAARLGRHCQLFHERLRPRGEIGEPLVLDSFQSFDHSQYHPSLDHLLLGQDSHYLYGFTDSECRRSGRMTAYQKRRRAELERTFGRPDPRSVEREVATLLAIVAPRPQRLELHTDEHRAYPRAFARVPHLVIEHHTVSSRAPRTSRNRVYAANLADGLIRHGGANHKRETIAFSKRRQSSLWRLWIFAAWRNYVKWFSERAHDATPAMRAGVCTQRWSVRALLSTRLFFHRIGLPERWERVYRGLTPTRRIPNARAHTLKYAF